jgi:hypothetical protein
MWTGVTWLENFVNHSKGMEPDISFGNVGRKPGFSLPYRSTRQCSWLKHCASGRKVAGSNLGTGFEIFHCLNTSGRTMALDSNQPLTEISTRDFP